MKYIITENRLDDIISKYLDNIDWWEWDIGDGEFNLADGKYESSKIYFRIQYSSTVPDHEFEVIYINDEMVSKLSKLFSIPSSDSIRTIINWFNKKYDKNLSIEDFEWMENDNEEYND